MTRRILIHYPVLNLGGAEMSTLRLARALADRGWRVDMVVTTGGGAGEAKLDPRVKLTALRSRAAGERFSTARTLGGRVTALPDAVAYGWQRLRQLAVSIPYLFRRYDDSRGSKARSDSLLPLSKRSPTGRPWKSSNLSTSEALTHMRVPSCLLAASSRAAVLIVSPYAV